MKRKMILGLLFAVILPAVLLFSACENPADNGDTPPPRTVRSVLGPAVTFFKLEGETDVKNVKLTWRMRSRADRYEVFRDGVCVGSTKGDTLDDYGLTAGGTYTYQIKAYEGNELEAQSAATEVTLPASLGSPSQTWDNSISNGNGLNTGGLSGNVFLIGGTYYRYSVSESGSGTGRTVTVSEATSTDGSSWDTPTVLETLSDSKLEGSAFRRVGDNVVLTGHHENGSDYTLGNFYLATIKPGQNSFTESFRGRPYNNESRDQSVFIDNDGSAYVISATPTDIGIYKLNADWTGFAENIGLFFRGERRETPYVMRIGEQYYFFSSMQSGWYPSQAKYATGTSINNWGVLNELGNRALFGTQYNYVAAYGPDGKKMYGLYGWRWANQYHHTEPEGNYPRLMILAFNGAFAGASYFAKVEYYQNYGLIGVQPGKKITQGATVSASSADAIYNNLSLINDGADMESSGYFRGGSVPYSLYIDLHTAAALKEIHLTTYMVGGSEGAFKYLLEGSTDGENYTTVLDGSGNWQVGFAVGNITVTGAYRYLRFTVNDIRNVSNGDVSIASWADGIIELAIFGGTQ